MDLLKNITYRTKFIITIVLVLVLLSIVGWRSIVGMRDINKELNSIYNDQFLPSQLTANLNIAVISWNRAVLNYVLAENMAEMDEYGQIVLAQRNAITERLEELSNLKNLSKNGRELMGKIQDGLQQAYPVQDRVIALSKEGRQEETLGLIRVELRPLIDVIDKNMTEFLLLQEKQLIEVKNITDLRYEKGRRRIFLIIGSALILMFLFIRSLASQTMSNINKLLKGVKLVAESEYKTAKVIITSNDEFGDLAAGFNQMVDKIEQNIIEIEQSQVKQLHQEKFAVLGKLSGSIAHEIKNPLGVIDSSVYLLKMKLKNEDDKTLIHLDRIKNQVDISNNIIISLQNLTKVKEITKVRFDIADSIARGTELSGISETGVEIIKVVEKGICFVDADMNQLALAFKNIIYNAMQAMDNKGNIWITASDINKEWCEISFRDSGPGITAENLKRIFDPFFSTKAKNTGLGLTLTNMIIEGNGGTIEARSEEGKGTTFIVRFPVSKIKGG